MPDILPTSKQPKHSDLLAFGLCMQQALLTAACCQVVGGTALLVAISRINLGGLGLAMDSASSSFLCSRGSSMPLVNGQGRKGQCLTSAV